MKREKNYTISFPQTYTCSTLRATADARKEAAKGLNGITFEIINDEGDWLITKTVVENDIDFRKMNTRLVKLRILQDE